MKNQMVRRSFSNSIFSLALALIFFSSCKGQVRTNLSIDSVTKQKTPAVAYPKIIKTHGTNEYANIVCSLQDKTGKLWFGTTGEGVYCYDGKLFTQFTTENGLCNNYVYCMTKDTSGNIWF